MPFRTLLSIIGVDQSDEDLKSAISLCKEIGAHLSVFVIALAAPPPIGEYAAVLSDSWREERNAGISKLQARVDRARDFLAAADVSCDVDGEYCEIAWTDDVVGERARYADVVVAGPELSGTENLKSYVLNGGLFESRTPVLLVARGNTPTLRPGRILVAWDSRIEASHAVHAALEMLAGADQVRVTLVEPRADYGNDGSEPGADIATYLARHGTKVTVDRIASGGNAIADVLRQHAIDISADMIVMGAYGHSRLRERILGGVTQSLVNDSPIPIFMTH